MKKIAFIVVILINTVVFSQTIIGGLTPDPHAQLEISSSVKGVLIPRITLTALDKPDPIATSSEDMPESLLVFNKGGDPGVPAGYYYWQNKRWNKLIVASDIVATTNTLVSEGPEENTITSTVNGMVASTTAVKTVSNAVGSANDKGYPLTTTINGIKSMAVDISQPWNVEEGNIKATANTQNIYQQGRVGIGVANMKPDALLDVRGGDALIHGVTVGIGSGNIVSNTVLGSNALKNNTTGYSNVAIGQNALRNSDVSYLNTAVGLNTLQNSTTSGNGNTAIGANVLENNTSGNANTAIGVFALRNNTIGGNNVAVGRSALTTNTEGKENTAVGSTALEKNTTASHNVAVGTFALRNNTTGNGNIAIGRSALTGNTTGSENIAIGDLSGGGIGDLTNTIAIGSGVKATESNTIVLGNSNITGVYTSGRYYSDGGYTSSDRSLKENIQTIPLGLAFINKIHPVEYIRKKDKTNTKEWGVIAQELQKVIGETGYKNAGIVEQNQTTKLLSVSYTQLIAPMIKAIQELSKENIDLKQQNDLTEQRLTKLEELIKKTLP